MVTLAVKFSENISISEQKEFLQKQEIKTIHNPVFTIPTESKLWADMPHFNSKYPFNIAQQRRIL